MLIKNFVIVVVLLLYTSSAFALGEIFKIETSGNEYCNDYDVTPFNANSNVDLWVRIDSETQLTVSLTPNFAPNTFFPMFGQSYVINSQSASFVGGVLFENYSYATIQGIATLQRNTSNITALNGVFVQYGVLDLNCYSSGSFTTNTARRGSGKRRRNKGTHKISHDWQSCPGWDCENCQVCDHVDDAYVARYAVAPFGECPRPPQTAWTTTFVTMVAVRRGHGHLRDQA